MRVNPCPTIATAPTECCRGGHSVTARGEERETNSSGTEPRRDMTMTKTDSGIPKRSTDRPRTDPPIVASAIFWLLARVVVILPWHPGGHNWEAQMSTAFPGIYQDFFTDLTYPDTRSWQQKRYLDLLCQSREFNLQPPSPHVGAYSSRNIVSYCILQKVSEVKLHGLQNEGRIVS